jgi:tartrate dehydrogenase/decarboxylase/D-malate dehydrogenase
MMLEDIGFADEAARVLAALGEVCAEGVVTGDVGGTASTEEMGAAVAARLTQ